MKIRNLLVAAFLTAAGTMGHAATVALNTPVPAEGVLGIPQQDFIPELQAAGVTHLYSGPMSLTASGPVRLTFTLVGAESSFVNTLNFGGSALITETGNSPNGINFLTGAFANNGNVNTASRNVAGGDFAPLLTYTNNQGSTFTSGGLEFGVFANSADIGALSVFWLALDDNGANVDDNHDDIIVRVDVSAVPLPASGLLLLAGLGGAFGLRRFRRAA